MVNTIAISGTVVWSKTVENKKKIESIFGKKLALVEISKDNSVFVKVTLYKHEEGLNSASKRVDDYLKPGRWVLITDGSLMSWTSNSTGQEVTGIRTNPSNVWVRFEPVEPINSCKFNGLVDSIDDQITILNRSPYIAGQRRTDKIRVVKDGVTVEKKSHVFVTGKLTGSDGGIVVVPTKMVV